MSLERLLSLNLSLVDGSVCSIPDKYLELRLHLYTAEEVFARGDSNPSGISRPSAGVYMSHIPRESKDYNAAMTGINCIPLE